MLSISDGEQLAMLHPAAQVAAIVCGTVLFLGMAYFYVRLVRGRD